MKCVGLHACVFLCRFTNSSKCTSTCFDVCIYSMHHCFVSVCVYYSVCVCVVLCGVGGGVLTVALMWIRGTMLQ